jgi:hypothetical protein
MPLRTANTRIIGLSMPTITGFTCAHALILVPNGSDPPKHSRCCFRWQCETAAHDVHRSQCLCTSCNEYWVACKSVIKLMPTHRLPFSCHSHGVHVQQHLSKPKNCCRWPIGHVVPHADTTSVSCAMDATGHALNTLVTWSESTPVADGLSAPLS